MIFLCYFYAYQALLDHQYCQSQYESTLMLNFSHHMEKTWTLIALIAKSSHLF